jgi:hypothetical protein
MRPYGANGNPADVGYAVHAGDLPFWRLKRNYNSRLLGRMRFAFLPVITAAILFTWQGFIGQEQHFAVVATSHPAPITTTIAKFVRGTLRGTFDTAPAASPSAYETEMQMSGNALMNRWSPFIEAASKRFAIPEAWIRTVMRMESGGRTMSSQTRPITSHAGAMGLMQVMPETYREMRAEYRLGNNAYDPQDNVMAGAAYLRWLHARYGYPAMFAAYNDGPGHFEDRLQRGEALPAETRNYVGRIAATLGGLADLPSGGLHGAFVSFTRPNGEQVSFAATAIGMVRAPLAGEYAPGVNAVVTVNGETQGVQESVDNVNAALRAHGFSMRLARKSTSHRLRLAALSHGKRVSVAFQG